MKQVLEDKKTIKGSILDIDDDHRTITILKNDGEVIEVNYDDVDLWEAPDGGVLIMYKDAYGT